MRSEELLVKDCLSGNKQAQYEMYHRFSGVLFGICLRYTRNRAEAEDLLQEAFIRIFAKINTFGFKGSLEGWLKRIVVNQAINFRRDNLKYLFINNSAGLPEPEPEDEAESFSGSAIPTEKLLLMIQTLPDGYRLVFNMYVFENLSHQQISEMLGISSNTSKTQLMKARKKLRQMVEAELATKKISVQS